MNKDIKKRILALALAGTMTTGLSGCYEPTKSEKHNNNNVETNATTINEVDETKKATETSKSVIEEIGDEVFKTDNYSLVYIDGKIYLARLNESFTYTEFYDALTNDLIGLQLHSVENPYKIYDKVHHCYVLNCYTLRAYYMYDNDASFYGGQYGYGKILPEASIYPLNLFIDSQYFGKNELVYFTSNSEELKQHLFSVKIPSSFEYVDYEYIERYEDSKGNQQEKIKYHTNIQKLQKVVCTTQNGEKLTFFGFRCSFYGTDMGYDQFYDYLTGKVYYIGNSHDNKFADVKIYNYNNKDKNLLQLQCEADRENLVRFSNKGIIVLYTTDSLEYIVSGEGKNDLQKYYFLTFDHKENIEGNDMYIYKDLINEGATATVEPDLSGCTYYGNNVVIGSINMFRRTNGTYQATIISNIDYILKSTGYSNMIRDDYTLEELEEINTAVNMNEHKKTK